jgi:tRNA pseudouridine55 synthase
LGHVLRLRRIWSGPFDAEDGISLEKIDELAKTAELDAYLRPLEEGLADLPELTCTPEAAVKLRNGNPAMVIASGVEYGDECWVSCDGAPVAVGRYKSGEVHPSRVFVTA